MRFEARELTSYAKPVSAAALEVGKVYYSLTYIDREMITPLLEPIVFIGRNLEPGDVDRVYFQDIESYGRGITFDPPDESDEHVKDGEDVPVPEGVERAMFYGSAQSDITNVFEYENALDELLKCSLRRGADRR